MKIKRRVLKKRRVATTRTPVRSRTTQPDTTPVSSESVSDGATRETPLPEQPTPLARPAPPAKSVDAPMMGLMREGDCIRISQPLLKALMDAVAQGYDSMRVASLHRLPDQRWAMRLAPDTLGPSDTILN